MTKKPILELEELLGRFFLKEWIQEDLREIGESTTGSKSELIDRYLHSRSAQSKSVAALGEELLKELPSSELKLVGQFLALKTSRNKDEIVPQILKSVEFEPYVLRTRRPCSMCGKNTLQEIHYDDAWQASAFKCQICATSMKIGASEEPDQPSAQALVPKVEKMDPETLPVAKPYVESPIIPGTVQSPAVVNIVEVKVEKGEPKDATYPIPSISQPNEVAEIRSDLKEIKESHGRTYIITLVLGLLAVGLALFGVGATSSVRYRDLYEVAGIGVCLFALGYFAISLWESRRRRRS